MWDISLIQKNLGLDDLIKDSTDDGFCKFDIFSAIGTGGKEEKTLVNTFPAEYMATESECWRDHCFEADGTVEFLVAGSREGILKVASKPLVKTQILMSLRLMGLRVRFLNFDFPPDNVQLWVWEAASDAASLGNTRARVLFTVAPIRLLI